MKKTLFLTLFSFLIGGIFLYFVLEKVGTKEIWEAILNFPPLGIIWVLIFTFLFLFFGAQRWQVILENEGYKLSLGNSLLSWLAGFAIGYFTPIVVVGDEVLKIYILKKKYSIPLRKSTMSVIVDDVLLDGTFFFLLIIFGILFFIFEKIFIPFKLWMIFFILLFPVGGLVFFYLRAFKKQSIIKIIERPLLKFFNNKIANGIVNCEKEIFDFLKVKNKNMQKATSLTILRWLSNLFRSWGVLYFLGIKMNFFQVLAILGFTNLACIFPLPAALGSHEAIQAFVFSNLNFSPASAVAFTLILRAFDTLLGIFGTFLIFRFGVKWTGDKIKNNKH